MNCLTGIRVVDLSQNLAGPYCTQILSDLGAEVVKIEPPAGDMARGWGPPFWGDDSLLFLSVNRNKKSVVLDLTSAEGKQALCELIATADVFVEAFRAGVADRLGFGRNQIATLNPRTVYVSVTAYGTTGPLTDQPGYDPLMQAHAGIMSLTGPDTGDPARAGVSLVDFGTGQWAALGVLAALREREETGEGAHVVASLLDSALGLVSYHLTRSIATNEVAARMGTGLAMIAPYEAFPTRDDSVMIAAGNDRIFARLCKALEAAELSADVRFADNASRVAHRSELTREISERTGRLSLEKCLNRLREHQVPCAPIQDTLQVVGDEQVQATGMLRTAPHPTIPEYQEIALPLVFNGARPGVGTAPPGLGVHTEEVLSGLSAKYSLLDPEADQDASGPAGAQVA